LSRFSSWSYTAYSIPSFSEFNLAQPASHVVQATSIYIQKTEK